MHAALRKEVRAQLSALRDRHGGITGGGEAASAGTMGAYDSLDRVDEETCACDDDRERKSKEDVAKEVEKQRRRVP